jgi:3-deoxy-D-manno-octulosonate 8-phosphate phosphatase (KDO 8-P phosphatase)
MIEAKGFHAHDGTGITLAHLAGLKTGLITKRISETVALRARDLKITHVFQGQADKTQALEKILAIENLTEAEVAFLGDDVIDLPVMRRCGLAMAVANARDEVKEESHVVTKHRGGEGAARDAVEFILRAQNRLEEVIDQYIATRPAAQKAVPSK